MKVSSARIREHHPLKPPGLMALSGFARQRTIRSTITVTGYFLGLFSAVCAQNLTKDREDATSMFRSARECWQTKRGKSRLSLLPTCSPLRSARAQRLAMLRPIHRANSQRLTRELHSAGRNGTPHTLVVTFH